MRHALERMLPRFPCPGKIGAEHATKSNKSKAAASSFHWWDFRLSGVGFTDLVPTGLRGRRAPIPVQVDASTRVVQPLSVLL